MSGVKRRTKYRKAVEEDVKEGRPEPAENQRIVRLTQSHGSNLLEVETSDGDSGLAILPTKFRKLVWVKRGDFLIVSATDETVETASGETGGVRFMVDHILGPPQILHLQERGLWPASFEVDLGRVRTGGGVEEENVDEEWQGHSRAGSRLERVDVGLPGEEEEEEDSGWVDRVLNRHKRAPVEDSDSESESSSEEDD